MRCDCCNAALSDYESTLKHGITGEYMNTCMKCLQGLNIPTVGREDLNPFEVDDDEFDAMDNQENDDE